MAQTQYPISVAGGYPSGVTVNSFEETFQFPLNGNMVDQAVFEAEFPLEITAISWSHAVAGNDAGAVNLQVKKAVTTDAPNAGTALLTNNSNAGFDMKATANTKQTGALTATQASLQLAVGNRINADFTGTVTTLAGGILTIAYKKI